MKKTILSMILLLAATMMAWAAGDIKVSFDVKNAVAGNVVLVYHMSINECAINGEGKGSTTLKGMDAVYANVYYGQQFRQVYLQDGDNVTLSFDANDMTNTFKATGGNEKAIDYLGKTQLLNLPDETYRLPFNEFKAKTEAKIKSMKRLLKARKMADTDKFVKMEEGRITYFYASGLLMYPVSHLYLTGDTTYTPDQAYYEAIKQYFKEDEDLVDIDEYRSYIIECAHIFDEENKLERQLYPKTVAEMSYIGEHFDSDKAREALIHHLAFTYVEGNGTDDIADLRNVYYAYVNDTLLTDAFQKACAKWDITAPGRPSPDFSAVDINGKSYTLKDFRGKYVYIDMWATWCAPCRKELPYLKRLEEKMRGRNITFLSLSIDSDKAKWEQKVKSGELSGIQLLLGRGSKFQKDYKIEGIPHFILIDPYGRIVNASMSRPSSDDTEKILNSLRGL